MAVKNSPSQIMFNHMTRLAKNNSERIVQVDFITGECIVSREYHSETTYHYAKLIQVPNSSVRKLQHYGQCNYTLLEPQTPFNPERENS